MEGVGLTVNIQQGYNIVVNVGNCIIRVLAGNSCSSVAT